MRTFVIATALLSACTISADPMPDSSLIVSVGRLDAYAQALPRPDGPVFDGRAYVDAGPSDAEILPSCDTLCWAFEVGPAPEPDRLECPYAPDSPCVFYRCAMIATCDKCDMAGAVLVNDQPDTSNQRRCVWPTGEFPCYIPRQ